MKMINKYTTRISLYVLFFFLTYVICSASNEPQTHFFSNFNLNSSLGIRVLSDHSSIAIAADQNITPSKSPNEAFLYSLAIPGMGQIYTGAKYGYIYTAAEVALLTTYFILRNNAVNTRDDFYDVVRKNVSFIGPGGINDWNDEDYEHAAQFETWNHVYDSENTRNRTGKWYWKDLDPTLKDEKDSAIEFDSKYRLEAYDLRQKANDTFQTARTILGLVIINHIVSAVEARITTKRYNNKPTDNNGFQIDVQTNGVNGELTGTLVYKKRF